MVVLLVGFPRAPRAAHLGSPRRDRDDRRGVVALPAAGSLARDPEALPRGHRSPGLRGPAGAPPGELRGGRGRDRRPHRAERGRQDHPLQPDQRAAPAVGRVHPDGRAGDRRPAGLPDRRARPGAHLPDPAALPRPHRGRERGRAGALERAARRHSGRAAGPGRAGRAGGDAGPSAHRRAPQAARAGDGPGDAAARDPAGRLLAGLTRPRARAPPRSCDIRDEREVEVVLGGARDERSRRPRALIVLHHGEVICEGRRPRCRATRVEGVSGQAIAS